MSGASCRIPTETGDEPLGVFLVVKATAIPRELPVMPTLEVYDEATVAEPAPNGHVNAACRVTT